MKSKLTLLGTALIASAAAFAAAPDGYYDRLEGESGVSLKQAIKSVVANHTEINYGDKTWDAFRKTDVKIVDGREAWWDMYSNNVVYVSTGHGGLNIEHSVANSWWDHTKNAAYKDLFHLNPSDANANSRKSNYPLGEIATVKWDNGVTFVGTAVSGQGGGAPYVYEPADQYKGDFARAFMYMFTVYDEIGWIDKWDYMYDRRSDLTLKPWAYELLLKWDAEDPVDEKELNRNEEIYKLQHNRNPYIDIPGLGQYVWGSKSDEEFHYSQSGEPSKVPAAPQFKGYDRFGGISDYAGMWWEPVTVIITAGEGSIRYQIDDTQAWQPYDSAGIAIAQAQSNSDRHEIRAITVLTADGTEYKSHVATLTLTARDPQGTGGDPVAPGEWTLVTEETELDADCDFVILASAAKVAMSASQDGKGTFMSPTSAEAVLDADGTTITELPADAGILSLVASGSGYKIQVRDTEGNISGWLKAAKAKSVTLEESESSASTASISFSDRGIATISFGDAGTLYYNSNAPRFTTYTSSSQQPLQLFMKARKAPEEAPAAPEFYAVDQDGNELTDGEFLETAFVELIAAEPAEIYYTLDGAEPHPGDTSTKLYSDLIELHSTATVKAVAVARGLTSEMAEMSFTQTGAGGIRSVGSPNEVRLDGRILSAPEGSIVCDARGIRVPGRELDPGMYIVVTRAGAVKIAVR